MITLNKMKNETASDQLPTTKEEIVCHIHKPVQFYVWNGLVLKMILQIQIDMPAIKTLPILWKWQRCLIFELVEVFVAESDMSNG